MKKKRQTSSDDEDAESPSTNRPEIMPQSETHVSDKPHPSRVNLAAKWLAMTSFSPLALPLGALPSFEFVELTTQRFLAVRERVAQTRMGFELLQEATTTNLNRGETWKERARAVEHVLGFQGTISREAAQALLKAQESRHSIMGVPPLDQQPELRRWHKFLEGPHGPFAFGAPCMSLMCQLDHAHANTLLHTVITKVQRGTRNQRPPARRESQLHEEVDDKSCDEGCPLALHDSPARCEPTLVAGQLFISEEFEEDGSEGDIDGGQEDVVTMDINGSSQGFSQDAADERTRELLRFLRFIMPCGSEGGPRSRGLGVWWYSAVATVDLLVDPDTDRALHDLFRGVCQHIKTLYDLLQRRYGDFPSDKRAAMMDLLVKEAHQSRHRVNDVQTKHYWDIAEVDHHDLRALFTMLTILAKFFHQNQNNLLNI